MLGDGFFRRALTEADNHLDDLEKAFFREGRVSEPARHMLIAGATGVATQFLLDIASAAPGWKVTGLCRRPPDNAQPNVSYVSADLLDLDSCRKAVSGRDFTHIVYAARAPHALYTAMKPYARVGIEEVQPNLAMLQNIVNAAGGPDLRHVHAVMGSKWYGIHIGPVRTPMVEADAGHMPPNYYFSQQKFLEEESARGGWSWSTSRPNVITGTRDRAGPNFISTIGAYAAICRHLGLPLDFPGKPGHYTSLQELSDAEVLAKSIFWMCQSKEAENQAFNVTNGDVFRWEDVWPDVARHFGMQVGRVRHMSLIQWMADKGEVWNDIVRKNGLRPLALDQVASWAFADFVFGWDYDVISSTTKIRKAGFHEVLDTGEMILAQLGDFQRRGILP
ncbi:SDR family oxidoreductase [Chelatococcus sp. YT9]|uniref:SDR family oxidoreductase n=1 Tax=Chelatococcus sp. YT9 TaxID=2835635 RepID=UPI001BD16C73|nr:SDR family oxidoreductase [Chelatococcus sp. YT9]MBS7697199.1 SDR family oxidoreductase [Chelatococcus sp. YT9]